MFLSRSKYSSYSSSNQPNGLVVLPHRVSMLIEFYLGSTFASLNGNGNGNGNWSVHGNADGNERGSSYAPSSFHVSTHSHSTLNLNNGNNTSANSPSTVSTSTPTSGAENTSTDRARYSTANTSYSSIDTTSLSLADVEANRARFVRLTQDFQKIHETTGSIEEEGLGGKNGGDMQRVMALGQEGALPMRSPIELSDEGSDGECLFDDGEERRC